MASLLAELQSVRRELSDLGSRVLALEARIEENSAIPVAPVTLNYTSVVQDPLGIPYPEVSQPLPAPSRSPPTTPPRAAAQSLVLIGSPVVEGRRGAAFISEEERRAAAVSIGRFLRRSLDGERRGASGRSSVNLPSRVYVLCRDREGRLYNPVSIHRSFSSICPLVKSGSCCGDSIFVGLPSVWEAKVATEAAGLLWPADG